MRLSLFAVAAAVAAPLVLAVACGGSAPPPATTPAPSTSASTEASTSASAASTETSAPATATATATATTTASATTSASASAKPAPSASATSKDAPKTVSLSPLGGKAVTVKVGAKLEYSYKSHPSVGYAATQSVGGAGVVKFLRNDIKLDRPAPAGGVIAAGGDGGTGTFVFEAVGKGQATITVEEQFRGKTEHASTFTITVE